jgi:hypothetical protein
MLHMIETSANLPVSAVVAGAVAGVPASLTRGRRTRDSNLAA